MNAAPLRKILIANRGEIAVRVIRACRELGLQTVAVMSEADRGAPYTAMAHEVRVLGGSKLTETYLNVANIVDAARDAGADAVHPGYGMLSENAEAVRQIQDAGLGFIGPPPDVIALMGDKALARRAAQEAGVPVAPASETLSNADAIRSAAAALGYPVIVKPVGGGGGIGMAIARDAGELDRAVASSQRLARTNFGNSHIYLERYFPVARHVEVQLLADHHGSVIHLGERECTVQRRYQKLIEETPSTALDEDLRARITAAAVRLAQAVGYRSAGTVEFLLAPDRTFYFLEMNTRIQVEHPVTEMVTGIDIVREQVRIAAGHHIGVAQGDVRWYGHAVECRIYAEDPLRNFLPSPGRLDRFEAPSGPGIRVDSGVWTGTPVTVYYDPLLCKITAWDQDRPAALARMRRALGEFAIDGVATTRDLQLFVLDTPQFRQGRVYTRILEDEWLPTFRARSKAGEAAR
jgi:acetyl-CoA carboxylase biotin carboxylase subunit